MLNPPLCQQTSCDRVSPSPTALRLLILTMIFAWILGTPGPHITLGQDGQDGPLAAMTQAIDEAEKAFGQGEFSDSAAKINDAIAKLEEILKATRREDVREIRLQHRRLVAAQRLLRTRRETTNPLPRLRFQYVDDDDEEMMEAEEDSADTSKVSFTETVAPILAQKCGRCHISRRSGDVSLASISQMVGLIEAGNPDGSQLYSVIEDGSMPKGNNKLSDDEKTAIREWINQGAKLDAAQLDFDLRPLMQSTAQPSGPAPEVSQATANDTVFFSRDIAPMLAESCAGCHINANQLRGGLSMDSFARMIRGGDSGPLWVAGNPDQSLIVQKLKGMGDGQRMPINRPAWNAEQIQKISTWIREGAHFDSPDPQTPLPQLASLSTIAAMDAESLKEHRRLIANRQWELALVGVQAERESTDHFHFVYAYGVDSQLIQTLKQEAERRYQEHAKNLMGSGVPAFAQAPITVFVPKSSYDYSEFGKMVESRDVPLQEKFHWDQTVDGPYLVLNGSLKPDAVGPMLHQTLPPMMVATWQPNLPSWFCNSVGHSVVDWKSDQLQSVQQYLANNPPSQQTIQQWTRGRLVTHMPYDIAASLGWKKSRNQLRRIRSELWDKAPLETVLKNQFQADSQQTATSLLRLGLQP